MHTYLEGLLEIAGPPLGYPTAHIPSILTNQTGPRMTELAQLLATRNGFLAFDGALHVLPIGHVDQGYDLTRWNSHTLWRNMYDNVQGCLFFAEDIFGEQFCIVDDQICRFDPETGEYDLMAESLEEWAYYMLDDFITETGYPIVQAWQTHHGALPHGQRLVPIIPFILGGRFSLENLRPLDAAEGMRQRAIVAQQVRNLPDGTDVHVIITP